MANDPLQNKWPELSPEFSKPPAHGLRRRKAVMFRDNASQTNAGGHRGPHRVQGALSKDHDSPKKDAAAPSEPPNPACALRRSNAVKKQKAKPAVDHREPYAAPLKTSPPRAPTPHPSKAPKEKEKPSDTSSTGTGDEAMSPLTKTEAAMTPRSVSPLSEHGKYPWPFGVR